MKGLSGLSWRRNLGVIVSMPTRAWYRAPVVLREEFPNNLFSHYLHPWMCFLKGTCTTTGELHMGRLQQDSDALSCSLKQLQQLEGDLNELHSTHGGALPLEEWQTGELPPPPPIYLLLPTAITPLSTLILFWFVRERKIAKGEWKKAKCHSTKSLSPSTLLLMAQSF